MSSSSQQQQVPSTSKQNATVAVHSCEICGQSGFTDDKMLDHTEKCIEGNAQCPFCGITGTSSAELLIHVNQAHLDYLTPENELMSFIDDSKSPSGEEDSDSMSCGLSPSIAEMPAGIVDNVNLSQNSRMSNGTISKQFQQNGYKSTTKGKVNGSSHSSMTSSLANGIGNNISNHNQMDDDNNNSNSNNNCDMANESGNNHSNGVQSKHGEGSPLRSQLELKLKANKPKITIPTVPSPLTCLLCPYTTKDPSVLEEHINRSHFDPISPGINSSGAHGTTNHVDTLEAFACPICVKCFETCKDLEIHVNHEHTDILSPAKIDSSSSTSAGAAACTTTNSTITMTTEDEAACNFCPVCGISFLNMKKTQEMELHIDEHFTKSPTNAASTATAVSPDLEKEARKVQEQREFEMLRAQYGMDDQGNFREQSAVAMQRAVYSGEMSVADYYCRQVGLRAAEFNGVDDGSSCTKSVIPRVSNLSASSYGVIKSYVCSNIDHFASSYGDRGWGCGYRNAQMMISNLSHNPIYSECLKTSVGSSSMPSISRLQKMVESAWQEGFDEQGKEQLGCKLYNTRKWIGATEIVTLLSWMHIESKLVDFHRPTALNGCHPELFNYVLRYFEQPKAHIPPLYLQHQGHSRTIIGVEQKASGLTLLILDPSHSPKQVASIGTSHDSLRILRRNSNAMKAPQYQIVTVIGKIMTDEEYKASKIIQSHRIPPDR